MSGVKAKPLNQRFWERVVKMEKPCVEGMSPCWLIDGKKKKDYASLSKGVGLGPIAAHRYSYKLHNGPIPRGKFVCHKCDVCNCVNPDHLYVGDHEDNTQDIIDRKRFARNTARVGVIRRSGELPQNRKLSSETANRMRAEYAAKKFTQMELAKRYGVSQGTVSATLRGVKNMGAGISPSKRSGNFKSKLSQEQRDEIRLLYATGNHTQKQLAERFGCDQTYVSLLCKKAVG